MFKKLNWLTLLAGLVVLPVSAWALPNGVRYTAHNFGATGEGNFGGANTGATETEVCIFCHTPHNAVASPNPYLWNRIASVNTFALYTASPTLNFTKAGAQLSDVSKMCMSCHDGATALNSMANPRSGTVASKLGESGWWEGPDAGLGEWGPNIGEWGETTNPSGGGNLTNDHPVSFNYDQSYAAESAAGTLHPIADAKAKGLVFWGPGQNMVECVTCHDPHVNYGSWGYREPLYEHDFGNQNKSLRPFLRKSNSSSALCFTCHNK